MVMSALENQKDWNLFCVEVQRVFSLVSTPELIMLSPKKALLEVNPGGVKDRITDAGFVLCNGEKILLSRWTPGVDTLPSSWFKPKRRWITFVGVPFHLVGRETMDSLCKNFGKVVAFAKSGPDVNGRVGMKVCVDHCDVRLIPHFIPLVDLGGVVYPVRTVIADSDELECEESFCMLSEKVGGDGFRSKRTFAQVAAGDGSMGGVSKTWKRCETSQNKTLDTTAIVETCFSGNENVLGTRECAGDSQSGTVVFESQEVNQSSGPSEAGAALEVDAQNQAGLSVPLAENQTQQAGTEVAGGVHSFDLNKSLHTQDKIAASPSTSLTVVSPEENSAMIEVLQGLDDEEFIKNQVLLDNELDSEFEDEVLEENSLLGDDADGHPEHVEEWFVNDAIPLGNLYGVDNSEQERVQTLLKGLKLNFGQHGKLEKKNVLSLVNDEGPNSGNGE